jgi:hypothetical protein
MILKFDFFVQTLLKTRLLTLEIFQNSPISSVFWGKFRKCPYFPNLVKISAHRTKFSMGLFFLDSKESVDTPCHTCLRNVTNQTQPNQIRNQTLKP